MIFEDLKEGQYIVATTKDIGHYAGRIHVLQDDKPFVELNPGTLLTERVLDWDDVVEAAREQPGFERVLRSEVARVWVPGLDFTDDPCFYGTMMNKYDFKPTETREMLDVYGCDARAAAEIINEMEYSTNQLAEVLGGRVPFHKSQAGITLAHLDDLEEDDALYKTVTAISRTSHAAFDFQILGHLIKEGRLDLDQAVEFLEEDGRRKDLISQFEVQMKAGVRPDQLDCRY
jgi:hypothetical protein